ncbi:hypothetical protein M8C21_009574 [Ambrosia artemisiifolia]|uniref:Morc S5 domain-containing protein n=1 Tax=Ambrosia artemisiifolia TaxID=4212 RepID=A0AAD5GUV1_AMBAR|nr:hypothetical protein M8C21_009574 [Ambrosia artemisiifolia]
MDISEFFSDYDQPELDTPAVKLESNPCGAPRQQKQNHNEENWSSTGTSVLDQEQSPVDDANLCSTSPICAAPVCRQFWKAGAYNDDLVPKTTTKAGSSYLHIHPKFLHSNATSHKWAFGAIAELIDNAVDEIQNNATYAIIDKTINPRNGSTALLIQDDGGGMDPEAMRHCLSFGFSDKKSKFAIGKYTFRWKWFQDQHNEAWSRCDSFQPPLKKQVHYQFNFMTGLFDPLHSESTENPNSNLSVILKWSPYSTEEELLKQFEDVGSHGTKVIIYNLWLDDDGNLELDFESDPEDICITWDGKSKYKEGSRMAATDQHLAKRLRCSLRAYLSVLYLKLPATFAMVLRKKVVLYHNIANDLKHTEYIMYRPQSDGCGENAVVTTIGFDKEAPNVSVHGFNIYHKNRLILPFQSVVLFADSRGRGVIGVLEADFIEPTHNKQDFEKTSLFQKLVTRLKEMTWEYWDYHCGLIGYQIKKKARPPSDTPGLANFIHQHVEDYSRKRRSADGPTKKAPAPVIATVNSKTALYSSPSFLKPVELKQSFPPGFKEGSNLKRKFGDESQNVQSEVVNAGSNLSDGGTMKVIDENKKLKAQCLELEKVEEELTNKVAQLKRELGDAKAEYARILAELQELEVVKGEN